MMDLIFMLLSVCISILFYIFIRFKKNRKYYEYGFKIPGPTAYPLIGSYLAIKNAKRGVLQYLLDSHDKFGDTVGHWVGTNLYTLITKPEDIEIVLRDSKHIKKSKNYDFLMPWLGKGLVTSTGDQWQTHRKILTPAFHFQITDRFLEVFNECGKMLIDNLSKHDGKEPFDIYPCLNLYALDAIIESAMGVKLDVQKSNNSEYFKAVHGITNLMHKRSFNPFLKPNLIYYNSKGGIMEKQFLSVIHGLSDKVIKQRKTEIGNYKESKESDDFGIKKRLAFLDLLLVGQKTGSGLSDQDIRDQVDTFMCAGHDTTATAMSFTIHHLANNPSIQDKVFEEIRNIFGDNLQCDITLNDLHKASYLDKVIKESMRLTPPIPQISRMLDEDLKISNYTLPAGSAVAILIYKLHRNPQIYPEPNKFDPERFSVENCSKRHSFAYVPFSAGPRNCIGQKYAQLEIKATLIKVLRNFEVVPGSDIKNVLSEVVLKSTNGQVVKIKKRVFT